MHIPVLLKEVLLQMNPQANENFVDCTLGIGGHAFAILELTQPKGRVLGIDLDKDAINKTEKEGEKRFQQRLIAAHGNYAHLKDIVEENAFGPINGILLDLGFSSETLESGRGFSFLKNEPLDMRFNVDNQLTAEKIVNYSSRQELEKIFKEFGEEEYGEDIAKEIVAQRTGKPILTTKDLVNVVLMSTPRSYQRQKIHPATRVFQALRIAVNGELDNLAAILPQAVELLTPQGRLAVISFHSLEDRIVKNFFKAEPRVDLVNKKPIAPSEKEVKENPRSRSAKLRVAVKK